MSRLAECRSQSGDTGKARLVSELGRKLRRMSEKIAASGEKRLTRRQLEREMAERRGGVGRAG